MRGAPEVVPAGRGAGKQQDGRGDRRRERTAGKAPVPPTPRWRLGRLIEVVRGFANDDVRQQGCARSGSSPMDGAQQSWAARAGLPIRGRFSAG